MNKLMEKYVKFELESKERWDKYLEFERFFGCG